MNRLSALWQRLDRDSRVPLALGIVIAIAAIFVHPLLSLGIGALAAVAMGFSFPASPVKVGILVIVPVMAIAYLVGLLRGVSSVLLLVLLVPSFFVPVALSKAAADVRRGRE